MGTSASLRHQPLGGDNRYNLIDAARLVSRAGMRPRLRQVTVILKSKDVRAFMNGWPAGRGRLS